MELRHSIALLATAALAACGSGTVTNEADTTERNPLTVEALALAEGNWSGELVYLDYSSDETVSLPLELEIVRDRRCLTLSFSYPTEPGANSQGEKCLSEDGFVFDGKPVAQYVPLGASTVFELAYEGEDNGAPATMLETYAITPASIRVETRFKRPLDTDSTMRNLIAVAKED